MKSSSRILYRCMINQYLRGIFATNSGLQTSDGETCSNRKFPHIIVIERERVQFARLRESLLQIFSERGKEEIIETFFLTLNPKLNSLQISFPEPEENMTKFMSRPRIVSLLSLFSQSGRKYEVPCPERTIHCFSSAVEVSEFEHDKPHDEVKTTEKDNALRLALSQLVGEFGRESMLSLRRFFGSRRTPVISTGSLKLDIALGIGGLPKGRIIEIYGREASGKTTLALHVIKEAQKLGGYCAYLDVENAIDPCLVEAIGIDTEDLLISHPDSAENLLSVVDTLTKSGSVDVIVVDSVAALVPQCEIDLPVGGVHRDMQSRIMTRALRKIHHSLCRSNTLIIFLNQVRANVSSGQGFGCIDEVTCGGNALKFYAAVRLRMMRKELLKAENKVMGLAVSVQVTKNKLAPPLKTADLRIEFGKGFQYESEVLELASEYGVIMKEGSHYIIEGQVVGSTYEAEQYLIENHGVLEKIVMVLREQLFERKL